MKQRLQHADAVETKTLDFLRAEADTIRESLIELRSIPALIPPGVIHGDAHLGNVIPSPRQPRHL